MPTITLNKKDLLKLIGKKLTNKQLEEAIPMLGTDLEKIEENEITVEVFPNRPDMLSEEGFARALSFFLNIRKKLSQYKVKNSNYSAKIDQKTKKVRPYVAAAVVKNIKLTDEVVESLMQLQEKLHLTHGRNRKKVSIGVYDLDKINFPLTYTTKPHNFKFISLDMKKELTLIQILSQHSKGKEYGHLLKGFNEFPIWLDANNKVLSLPPIINSEETRITQKTKNLFIDATGLDQIAVEQAVNIIVTALAERGAEIYEVKINNKPYPNLNYTKQKININYVNKLLGLNLNQNEIKSLLLKMGIDYKNNYSLIPPYRTDILHEIDVVEDIAIAYGYENFKTEIPNISTIGEESFNEIFYRKITSLLTGLGFIETNTFHLTNKENLSKKMETETGFIELKNALTEEYNILRSWLIPSLMEVLSKNKHHDYPQKIFEIGKVFTPKTLEEPTRLSCLICSKNTDFTEIRQVLDSLLTNLNIKYEIKEIKQDSFIPGRIGRIMINQKDVGIIGELHPKVITNWELSYPITAFELELDVLIE